MAWNSHYTEPPMKVPITPHHLKYSYYGPPPIFIALRRFSHGGAQELYCAIGRGHDRADEWRMHEAGPRQEGVSNAMDGVRPPAAVGEARTSSGVLVRNSLWQR